MQHQCASIATVEFQNYKFYVTFNFKTFCSWKRGASEPSETLDYTPLHLECQISLCVMCTVLCMLY